MQQMRTYGNRTIKVKKAELLKKIKENKEKHIQEYKDAVIAYKEEALEQLAELTKKANEGCLKIQLSLTHPVDKAEEYDKLILMFEMEVENEVELEQSEFNAYVFDELDFAASAKMSNMAYHSRTLSK